MQGVDQKLCGIQIVFEPTMRRPNRFPIWVSLKFEKKVPELLADPEALFLHIFQGIRYVTLFFIMLFPQIKLGATRPGAPELPKTTDF